MESLQLNELVQFLRMKMKDEEVEAQNKIIPDDGIISSSPLIEVTSSKDHIIPYLYSNNAVHSNLSKNLFASLVNNYKCNYHALILAIIKRYRDEIWMVGQLINTYTIRILRIMRKCSQDNSHTLKPNNSPLQENKYTNRNAKHGEWIYFGDSIPPLMFPCNSDMLPSTKQDQLVLAHVQTTLNTCNTVSERLEISIEGIQKSEISSTGVDIRMLSRLFGFELKNFNDSKVKESNITDHKLEWNDEVILESSKISSTGLNLNRSANDVIGRHPIYHDIRGIQALMDAYAITKAPPPTRLISQLQSKSAIIEVQDIKKSDPFSYTMLDKQQKQLWSNERVNRAKELLVKERTTEALEQLSRSLTLDSNNIRALKTRGQVRMKLNQYDDALADFKSIQLIDPNHAKVSDWILSAESKLRHKSGIRSITQTAIVPSCAHSAQMNSDITSSEGWIKQTNGMELDRLHYLLKKEERKHKRKRRRENEYNNSDESESTVHDRKHHKRTKDSKHRKKKKKDSKKKSKHKMKKQNKDRDK